MRLQAAPSTFGWRSHAARVGNARRQPRHRRLGHHRRRVFLADETKHLLTDELVELGQVQLVHAHEWNLTPEGPLPMPERTANA